jgi:hypothetical protein
MSSQTSDLNPKVVKYILTFFQWLFAFSVIFSVYTFINTEKIIDLVSAILFLRFSISAYQLDMVYNKGIVYEYFATIEKVMKFRKKLGRRKRRQNGIKLKDDLY